MVFAMILGFVNDGFARGIGPGAPKLYDFSLR